MGVMVGGIMRKVDHNRDVMVSVMCYTYNHVNTIRDALEGFLMQKADFTYDVFIYDDASTDGTSDIVREYVQKYPDIFHAFIEEKNMYRNPDRRERTHELETKNLSGKYIAMCEGDDFWIDCNKLQIQVEFMESHPECEMYLHNALWLNCENSTMKSGNLFDGADERDLSAEEIIMQYGGHPATSSFLYKKELLKGPHFFYEASVGDYTLLLHAFARGSVHYSNRIMSVYRYMKPGSYSENLRTDDDLVVYYNMGLLHFLHEYDRYTEYRHHKWCSGRIQWHSTNIVNRVRKDVTIKESILHCMGQGYPLVEDSLQYADNLEIFRPQWCDEGYMSDQVKEFIESYKHIFIMGAGKCGMMLAKQLINNGAHFEGFTVTKKDKDAYMGKPVFSLNELAGYDSLGVLIGINPVSHALKEELENALKKAGVVEYYYPFEVYRDES